MATPKEEVLEAIGQVRKILEEPQPLTPIQLIQAKSFLEYAELVVTDKLTVGRPRKEAGQ